MEERKTNIDGLLARHLCGEPLDGKQQAELDAWVKAHADEYRRLKELTGAMPDFDADKAWSRVEARLGQEAQTGRYRRLAWKAAAAAGVLLVLAVGLMRYLAPAEASYVNYTNLTAEVKQVMLPDSSEVTLYPGAHLAWRVEEEPRTRQAGLEGKAFFRVKKRQGLPFRVDAAGVGVEVLGTSFLVDAAGDGGQAGVYVETGRVRVTAGREEVVLGAGEQAVTTGGSLRKETIARPDEVFGRREMVFENTPLADVVKEVERQTGIRIELGPGLEGYRITSRMDSGQGSGIAAELAFLCRCRCDTLEAGKRYRLRHE